MVSGVKCHRNKFFISVRKRVFFTVVDENGIWVPGIEQNGGSVAAVEDARLPIVSCNILSDYYWLCFVFGNKAIFG